MRSVLSVFLKQIPEIWDECVAPIVFTVHLQLLSCDVAVLKGTDVDQPRNLAKSVTVEEVEKIKALSGQVHSD